MKKAIFTIVGLSLILGLAYVSISNQEIKLRNKIEAQEQNIESFYDKMWKILQEKAGVSNQYKEAFKEIYPSLMEGRYGNARGGALMSWVTEHNPEFKTDLYIELTRSIEAERTGFFIEQKKMIDMVNQHRIMQNTLPSKLVVGNREPITYVVISSDSTKEIMNSRVDNNTLY